MDNYFMYRNNKIVNGTKIIFSEDFCNKNKYALNGKNSCVFRGVTYCNDGKKGWYFDNRCFQDFVPERDIKGIGSLPCNNQTHFTKRMSLNDIINIIFPQLMLYIALMLFFSITNYIAIMWPIITFVFLCKINKKLYS